MVFCVSVFTAEVLKVKMDIITDNEKNGQLDVDDASYVEGIF